jgi:glyoxylase-like metal-dependent hydrolase (beta-lactamase superfamily II)
MKKTLLLFLVNLPLFLFSQSDWSTVEITTTEITDKIAFLVGRGGNIGVLHGPDGVMIIDDQYAPLSEKITGALADLSQSDLKFIVNTHYHGDHTGGNENLSANGASIVAHQKVRERLGTTFYSEMMDREIASKPESFWPTITFNEDLTFFLNGEEIRIQYVPNTHTDGDAIVFFATSNVIHTGDAFVRYGYPYIDVAAGGSIDGFIAAQRTIMEMANQSTKIIPGHGELSDIVDVQELLDMLLATRQIIATHKSQGKSLDEILTMNPLEGYHEKWSGSFINSDLFARSIFESLP